MQARGTHNMVATESDVKLFNRSVLSLRTAWQGVQTNFHTFMKSDKSNTISSEFDISKADQHIPAFEELARLFNTESDLGKDSIQDVWLRVFKTELKSKSMTVKRVGLIGSCYIFISILLMNGDYYKTLQIMVQMIKLGETDPKLSLAALTLALELEEMELFVEIRKLVPANTIAGVYVGYLQALDCNLRARKCRENEKTLCSEIYKLLATLSITKPMTYAMCYTEILLRTALVHLAKKPKAMIQLTGDHLYNLQRCYDIAFNALSGLYGDSVKLSGPMQMFDGEKPSLIFDKVYVFHRYCMAVGNYTSELFNYGLLSDFEHRFVPYFKFTLLSASPYRILKAVNYFYLMRQITNTPSEMLKSIGEWIRILGSINYDWILQHEQKYGKVLISNFSKEDFKEFYELRQGDSITEFGQKDVTELLFNANKKASFLPFSYADNLLRSTYHFFKDSAEGKLITIAGQKKIVSDVLKRCEVFEVQCRAYWLLLRHLGRPTIKPLEYSWLNCPMGSQSKFSELKFEEIYAAFLDAYSEYKDFRHLFYPLWRRQCATYIAANVERAMQKYRPYHVAMHFSETMSMSLRASTVTRETELIQPMRLSVELEAKSNTENLEVSLQKMSIQEKKIPEFSVGFINGSEEFRDFVRELPNDITVFQFVFDSNDVLWLVRFHRNHDPYSVPLCYVKNQGNVIDANSSDPLISQLQVILKESEATTAQNILAKDFWDKRRRLNERMEKLVFKIESKFLGDLWPLCYAYGPDAMKSSSASKVQKEIEKMGFSRAAAIILTQLIDQIEKDEWLQILKLMAEREQSVNKNFVEQVSFDDLKTRMGSKQERCAGDAYIFLVLPPSLSSIPWECMPVFKDSLVSRIPSIFTLKALIDKHKLMPKPVNAHNSYYVLNPTGNLPATQKRLEGFVSNLNWRGVVGKIPPKEDLINALQTQDMYVFLGHGSGRKYIGGSRGFKTLDCRSVCLLMGCSSVEIVQEGYGFDGRSSVYDFILAHCPCLIGCLWMVTDGEADRFFMELMRFCFEELKVEAEKRRKTQLAMLTPRKMESKDAHRFIMRGIAKARNACKLPYLTGGAVVLYGLPTFAHLS